MRPEELIEYILRVLLSQPDDIVITRTVDELGVLLSISVNKLDLPIIIGKEGEMARALRTIARSMGYKHREKTSIKITT
mgnify:CR=1 FL=1